MRDLLDSEEAVEETDDIVAVQPENLKSLNAKEQIRVDHQKYTAALMVIINRE